MAKIITMLTCVYAVENGMKCTMLRRFVVPVMYEGLNDSNMLKYLEEIVELNASQIIAFRRIESDGKRNIFSLTFKELSEVNVNENEREITDWFINPKLDQASIGYLDKRIDPIILIIGEPKRLKYRINYYLHLLQQGYSSDEIIDIIYS